MTEKQKLIYKITSLIPYGKVLTYKILAQMAGVKNPRVIGNILHQNKDPKNIPCHRVVHTDGTLSSNYAFGGIKAQKAKLKKEKVGFEKGKVKLSQYLWKPKFNNLPS